MKKSRDIFALAAIAAGIFAVFGSAIFFKQIISDDVLYVSRMHLLELSWKNIRFWTQPVMALRSPLAAYSFMIDFFIWGKDLFIPGAHLGNILLHLAAAAGIFTGMRLLKFSTVPALAGTLLWAVHPQRAESIAWLSERKDVLLLALSVWSIVFFIRSMQKHKWQLYVISLLLFILTFAVKPAAIGLPIILTAFLWGRYRRKTVGFYLKYTGLYYLTSLICFCSFFFDGGLAAGKGKGDLINTAAVVFWRYSMYWQKTFFPADLNPTYPHFSLAENSLLPLFLSGIGLILLLEMLRRKNKQALYLYLPLVICYSAAVAPALQYIGDVDLADRYSYFPSIFLITGIICAWISCCRRYPAQKKILQLLLWCIIVSAGVLGFREVQIWKTEDSLHAAAMRCARPNYRVIITEAVRQYRDGNYAKVYETLYRLDQDYTNHSSTHQKSIELFTLAMEGMLLFRAGNPDAGIRKLEKALRDPQHRLLLLSTYQFPRMVMLRAASFYQRRQDRRNAAEMYRMIAGWYREFEPLEDEFYRALAALCLNDKKSALRHFKNALKYNPDDQNIRRNIEALQKKMK